VFFSSFIDYNLKPDLTNAIATITYQRDRKLCGKYYFNVIVTKTGAFFELNEQEKPLDELKNKYN